MPRVATGLALFVFILVGIAIRGSDVSLVFPPGGDVVFTLADALYHLRRALYSFVNFPSVLYFDPYINHPEGSAVPWPPFFDLLLAALARAFGDSVAVFERVVAWSSPLFGALTVLPVYAIARVLGGRGVGLGAAALVAVLPVAVNVSRLGNPDHHAFVTLVGATWLALCVGLVHRDTRGSRLVGLCLGVVLVRALMTLSWSGSLLYIALADGCVLLVALLSNRRELLLGMALGAFGSALLVAPWVFVGGTPTGGPFSTITLSWFHVVVLVAMGTAGCALVVLESFRPGGSAAFRVLRAGLLATAVFCLLLMFPAPRDALLPATEFMTKSDSWAVGNLEARALFASSMPRAVVRPVRPEMIYGWFAYLLPLAGLAVVARTRKASVREPAACVAVWSLVLGTLAVYSMRFGYDFAPYAAVAIALLLAELHELLTKRLSAPRPVATGAVLAVGLLGLWPPVSRAYVPELDRAIGYLRQPPSPEPRPLGPYESVLRFGRIVREVTPETEGYLGAGLPAYGILCHESMGHAFRYASHRAVPADNFGPYLDRSRFTAVRAFFTASSEAEGIEIAEQLRTPYVVTDASHAAQLLGLGRTLHRLNGSGQGSTPHLERFRLITEGPAWGGTFYPMRGRVKAPYKLFELVAGAVLEARAEPGTPMVAGLTLVTPLGTRFVYRARGRVGADGVGRLRVSYATDTRAPTRNEGPYRVYVGSVERSVEVSDAQVRAGSVIALHGTEEPSP